MDFLKTAGALMQCPPQAQETAEIRDRMKELLGIGLKQTALFLPAAEM